MNTHLAQRTDDDGVDCDFKKKSNNNVCEDKANKQKKKNVKREVSFNEEKKCKQACSASRQARRLNTHTHTQEKKITEEQSVFFFFFNYREHGKERHEGEQLALS